MISNLQQFNIQIALMFQENDQFPQTEIKKIPNLDTPSKEIPSQNLSLSKNAKDGFWNKQEIFKFISYLIYNRQILKLKLQRRTNKVFKQMALFIASRTSVQCRSQNQRLFRKYKNIRNIIASFKEQYGREQFQHDYKIISMNPNIKFKTQYQNFIDHHQKSGIQIATQTDYQLMIECYSKYMEPWQGNNPQIWHNYYPNNSSWVFVPYYS